MALSFTTTSIDGKAKACYENFYERYILFDFYYSSQVRVKAPYPSRRRIALGELIGYAYVINITDKNINKAHGYKVNEG